MAAFPDAPGLIELLLKNCQKNLAGIRREFGYTTDVEPPIYDKAFNAFQAPRLPSAGIAIIADQPNPPIQVFPFEGRSVLFRVEGWLRERKAGSLLVDVERYIVDVYRAMLKDVSQGGLAMDTFAREVVRVEHEDSTARESGFTAVYECQVRWLVGDPTVPDC